jgi:DNA-binding response OmpR family regulator
MAAVILVVEDQPAMQRNMRMSLTAAGYDVITAADGVEALAVLDTQPVDLILADIAMPRMNGYQLYQALRENPRWALIPFVFVSARALDSDVRYGKSQGVDDYLIKPFALEDLLAIVAGRLRRAEELARAVGKPEPAPPSPVTRNAPAAARAAEEVLTAGPIRMHPRQHRVWRDGAEVELSLREFKFLEYLLRRPGQAVSLVELCRVTHDLQTTPVDAGNLLYPLVRSLRRRLGYKAGEMGCIESVRGVGYRLGVEEKPD